MLNRRRPPDIDETSRSDAWFLMGVARAARKLGRRDLARLVRWAPMSVADLVSEWFDSQMLCAAIAAHAIAGNPAGPRSAGTGAMLLQRLAADPMPAGSGVTIKGGPGALAAAVADVARAAGADIRTDVRVTQIVTENGAAAGVLLANGDTLQARTILAAVSPKLALTGLVAAPDLPPSFAQRMRHVRSRGVTAKINLALSAMPVFPALADDAATLGGRILIAPDARLPGARIRRDEVRRNLTGTVARDLDSERARRFACARGRARHVDLRALRSAGLAKRRRDRRARRHMVCGAARPRGARATHCGSHRRVAK